MNTNNIFERIREQFSEMAGSTQEYQRLLELLKQMEGKFGINPAYRLTPSITVRDTQTKTGNREEPTT